MYFHLNLPFLYRYCRHMTPFVSIYKKLPSIHQRAKQDRLVYQSLQTRATVGYTSQHSASVRADSLFLWALSEKKGSTSIPFFFTWYRWSGGCSERACLGWNKVISVERFLSIRSCCGLRGDGDSLPILASSEGDRVEVLLSSPQDGRIKDDKRCFLPLLFKVAPVSWRLVSMLRSSASAGSSTDTMLLDTTIVYGALSWLG